MYQFLKEYNAFKIELENPKKKEITFEEHELIERLDKFNWRLAYDFAQYYLRRAAIVQAKFNSRI